MKYFTLEEANALLPTLKPLVAQLVEKQAHIAKLTQETRPLLSNLHHNIGSPQTSELTLLFDELDTLLAKVQAHGCVVKNVGIGLLDFLANFNGRDVFLCWKHGEPSIRFYHEVDEGFNGRKPV